VEEPIKGWIDNFNGPVGLLVGGGKGILRVAYLDPSIACDFMPVDVAIKITIIAAWKRGIKTYGRYLRNEITSFFIDIFRALKEVFFALIFIYFYDTALPKTIRFMFTTVRRIM
jgi:hypothetical protein